MSFYANALKVLGSIFAPKPSVHSFIPYLKKVDAVRKFIKLFLDQDAPIKSIVLSLHAPIK